MPLIFHSQPTEVETMRLFFFLLIDEHFDVLWKILPLIHCLIESITEHFQGAGTMFGSRDQVLDQTETMVS